MQIKLKVIPLFCTAHPLLRITLPHPGWRRLFSPARKEQTRAAFAELKLLFAIIMPQIGRTASWFAIEKQENERNVRVPEVCSNFSLRGGRVVELLKCTGWGFGLWGLWSLWEIWVKHFFGYLVYGIFLWPESWRGSLYIYLLSFPKFWTLSIERFWFLFWYILNGVTLKTCKVSLEVICHILNYFSGKDYRSLNRGIRYIKVRPYQTKCILKLFDFKTFFLPQFRVFLFIFIIFFSRIINTYSSSPTGLWVNSPFGLRPHGL